VARFRLQSISAVHGDNWCFALTRKAHFQKPNVSKVSIFGLKLITYIHTSPVSRRDSLGNTGRIVAGDVQVMSAGTGIRRDGFNLEPQTTKGDSCRITLRQLADCLLYRGSTAL
jgi:redox-sensitive bicupin YhaK (pirin superfamily)